MKHKVADFIMRSMMYMDDGCQKVEEDGREVTDDSVPSAWGHDGNKTIWVRWGGQIYDVVIKKKRAKKPYQRLTT